MQVKRAESTRIHVVDRCRRSSSQAETRGDSVADSSRSSRQPVRSPRASSPDYALAHGSSDYRNVISDTNSSGLAESRGLLG
jgi:hypothetical protein